MPTDNLPVVAYLPKRLDLQNQDFDPFPTLHSVEARSETFSSPQHVPFYVLPRQDINFLYVIFVKTTAPVPFGGMLPCDSAQHANILVPLDDYVPQLERHDLFVTVDLNLINPRIITELKACNILYIFIINRISSIFPAALLANPSSSHVYD